MRETVCQTDKLILASVEHQRCNTLYGLRVTGKSSPQDGATQRRLVRRDMQYLSKNQVLDLIINSKLHLSNIKPHAITKTHTLERYGNVSMWIAIEWLRLVITHSLTYSISQISPTSTGSQSCSLAVCLLAVLEPFQSARLSD